jgi:hypothetical protein
MGLIIPAFKPIQTGMYFSATCENTIMKSKSSSNAKNAKTKKEDLSDSKKDQQKMESEEIVIDMPEVKDIPGQENIKVPRMREMEDVTISSDDEEGKGILDDLNKEDDEELLDDESNVSKTEASLLRESATYTPNAERNDLKNITLDQKDNDGDKLNEKSFSEDRFGEDLDVPGADLDDDDEETGNEDEENNLYSNRD